MDKSRAGQMTGGLFLIGLAIIFLTGFWWPGMLFLIGFVTIANGLLEGREWEQVTGGFFLIGLGVVFAIGFNVGVLLLMIGVTTLLGAFFKSDKGKEWVEKPKRKNDEFI
jgi:hypothetical protein